MSLLKSSTRFVALFALVALVALGLMTSYHVDAVLVEKAEVGDVYVRDGDEAGLGGVDAFIGELGSPT